MLEEIVDVKISVLRFKILSEVVEWLGTKSALDSFARVFYLAFIDCLESLPPPIHSQSIAEMMIVSLTLTDWPQAIESLKEKTRAIGFGT
jgi:hypothetical protein